MVIGKRKYCVQLGVSIFYLINTDVYSAFIMGSISIAALTLYNSYTVNAAKTNPVQPLALVPGKENVWVTYGIKYHLN